MMKAILVMCLVSLAAFGESKDCNRGRMKMHLYGKGFHGKGDCDEGGLKMNFYGKSCPRAEMLVRNITWTLIAANPDLAADLLRLHYHDCFVRGCDASLLLDTADAGVATEKKSEVNQPLEGFDEIDEIKSQMEKECPGIVSCADIVALAARDGVSFQFGKSMWDVLTGRRDGKKSVAADVAENLPSPFSDFATLRRLFSTKGLDVKDLVALSGAHTIGHAHCKSFAKRLYNFTGKGDADPSLDAVYAESLRKKCPNPFDPKTLVMMDLRTPDSFDGDYFKNLFNDEGLFQSDASLLTNGWSASIARQLQDSDRFFAEFADSMKNMGAIEVLTGTNGEIRQHCRVVNHN